MIQNGVLLNPEDLIDIIERKGWTLYDVSDFPNSRPNWEELEHQTRAKKFEVGRNYFLVPIPSQGQTLREAYSVTKGLGPSLEITDPRSNCWYGLYLPRTPTLAVFTRLVMIRECALLTSPIVSYYPDPDAVGIKYEYLIEVFEQYFGIVEASEYGLLVQTCAALDAVGETVPNQNG